MGNNRGIPCDDLLSYLVDELGEDQRGRFENHLGSCGKCREELNELRPAWNSLSSDLDMRETPDDLKAQVFQSIFAGKSSEDKEAVGDRSGSFPASSVRALRGKSFRFRWDIAAAVMALLLAVSVWQNVQMRANLASMQQHLSSPSYVLQSYRMYPAGVETTPSGEVLLVEGAGQRKLIVQMSGLRPNTGEEVYQVWLIRNGIRTNAGTFRADENGRGVLTYNFASSDPSFEQIGITLEPDANGTQPRGVKVSGTVRS